MVLCININFNWQKKLFILNFNFPFIFLGFFFPSVCHSLFQIFYLILKQKAKYTLYFIFQNYFFFSHKLFEIWCSCYSTSRKIVFVHHWVCSLLFYCCFFVHNSFLFPSLYLLFNCYCTFLVCNTQCLGCQS